jgi:hypothetical protein
MPRVRDAEKAHNPKAIVTSDFFGKPLPSRVKSLDALENMPMI